MVTKKQMKTGQDWAEIAISELKKAHQNPKFTLKTEKKKIKDTSFMMKENIFMWIVIEYGKDFKMTYPLTEEEYKKYKKLEAEIWGK